MVVLTGQCSHTAEGTWTDEETVMWTALLPVGLPCPAERQTEWRPPLPAVPGLSTFFPPVGGAGIHCQQSVVRPNKPCGYLADALSLGPQDSSGGPSLRAAHTYLDLSLSACRQWTWEVPLCLGQHICIHKIEPSKAPTHCETEERTQLRLASGFAITLRPSALKMWSMEGKFLHPWKQCIPNPWNHNQLLWGGVQPSTRPQGYSHAN